MKNDSVIIKVTESITSSNVDEWREKLDKFFCPKLGLTLDCTDMQMIASAGLRVLLSYQKRMKAGEKLKLINVNSYVLEVLDTTGFRELLEVHRMPREISVDGLKPFARGLSGECYKLDEETLLKLYFSGTSTAQITKEKNGARAALVAGISTALSYEMVKVGDRQGIIYELLHAKTLAEVIAKQPEKLSEIAKAYAQLALQLHSKEGDASLFPKWTDTYRAVLSDMTEYPQSVRDSISRFLDQLEGYPTYVHGDFNVNNIMISDGELMLIDMADFAIGCPMYDVASLYFSFCYLNKLADDEVNWFDSLTGGQERMLWNEFIREYFQVEDFEEAKEKYPEADLITRIALIKGAYFVHTTPDGFPVHEKEMIQNDVKRCFS